MRKLFALLALIGCTEHHEEPEAKICELMIGQGGYAMAMAVTDPETLRTDIAVWDTPNPVSDIYVTRLEDRVFAVGERTFKEHPMWNCRQESERHW